MNIVEYEDRTKVIAFYRKPDGTYERRELWRIDYEEAVSPARAGRLEGFDPLECEKWSLEEPPEGAEIKDRVPSPRTLETLPEAAPPMVKRHTLTAEEVQRKVRTGVARRR